MAAWYLQEYHNIVGMNLDIDHPLGAPPADALEGLGHVRMLYNVSLNPSDPVSDPQHRYGNTNLDFTFSRYFPHVKRYVDAGLRVILVFTHQTYGEGREEFWGPMGSKHLWDKAERPEGCRHDRRR